MLISTRLIREDFEDVRIFVRSGSDRRGGRRFKKSDLLVEQVEVMSL